MARQLITPHPTITCTPGMCLEYVRRTFEVNPHYSTATSAWGGSEYRHEDQNFPANIWVPVWFSLADNPNGHVALRQPDGTVWSASHPTLPTPVHHASLAEMESYYQGQLRYLGWTEDIEDTMVVKLTTTDKVTISSTEVSNFAKVPAPIIPALATARVTQDQESPAGLQGDTGHRPGHPAIEHMRINRQIEEERRRKKR